jgi:myo-inositol-1(or 4)-monophosphatase
MTKNTVLLPEDISRMRLTAIEAAREAGEVLKHYFGGTLKISEKKGAGLVSNADLEAQAKCVAVLKKDYPHFGFLTEEAAPETGQSPGRWIIDPLDGTTNYIHGFPMFCVSVAAEWHGELLVGVIYHPILNELYVGVKDQGATVNDVPLRVSPTHQIEHALLTTGFTYKKEDYLKDEIAPFEKLSGRARAIRRPGSAALDLAYTARGVFDGFWEQHLSPWDVAAGVVLVRESGGKVTNYRGEPFNLDFPEILATNSHLHSTLLAEISGSA